MTGKKKPGNPHLRGPSGFSKPPKMVGRVGFEPTTNWLKANWFAGLETNWLWVRIYPIFDAASNEFTLEALNHENHCGRFDQRRRW